MKRRDGPLRIEIRFAQTDSGLREKMPKAHQQNLRKKRKPFF
jgi:hypothetical protein